MQEYQDRESTAWRSRNPLSIEDADLVPCRVSFEKALAVARTHLGSQQRIDRGGTPLR